MWTQTLRLSPYASRHALALDQGVEPPITLGGERQGFHDRRRVMRSLKKWLVDNQETCAKVACRDTGKTSEFVVALSASLQCAGAHVAA